MAPEIRIESDEALQSFIDAVYGFHDALLHEAVLFHPGHVLGNGFMYGDNDLPNARMVFQSQFPDVLAVRIDLKRVSAFRLEDTFNFEFEGLFSPKEIVLYPFGQRTAARSEIRAEEMTYTFLGKEFLGASYHLVRKDEIDGEAREE